MEQMAPDFSSPEELSEESWEIDPNEEDLLEELRLSRKSKGTRKRAPADEPPTRNPLQQYLNEIHRFPALSKEEELALAILYREKGDLHAAHRLVNAHLLLVVKIALSYGRHGQGQSALPDLIQEGNIGLLESLKRFDPHRGWRFSTYAGWWIRAHILKFIMDNWKLVRAGTSNPRRKLFYARFAHFFQAFLNSFPHLGHFLGPLEAFIPH
ncbi:MAG: sigma-70 family RNA polymerase sigma factor, partial [Candidatus Tectomicrobia bacterium]|nr:sigma-70 family RNA polymerase sigma factor [Candidatus Tectomicrobia bacterium]